MINCGSGSYFEKVLVSVSALVPVPNQVPVSVPIQTYLAQFKTKNLYKSIVSQNVGL